jgi:putative endonuclease
MSGKEAMVSEKEGNPGRDGDRRPSAGTQRDQSKPPTGLERSTQRPARKSAGARSRQPTGRRTLQQQIGQRAEDIAADFLQAQGLQILERNYRRRLGELDIVARDGDVLVIVEVRARASSLFGGAAASVDGRKQQRLVRATAQLLQQRRDFSHCRVRFDVISVSETGLARPRVEWFQHAFLT